MTNSPQRSILSAWARLMSLYVVLGFLLRIVLALHPMTVASSLSFWQWIVVFVLGAVNDALVMSVMMVPLIGFWMSSGHWKLHKPQCYVFMGLIAALWAWITFGCKTLHDFNRGLADVLGYVVLFWLASFALRTFVPRIRRGWMRGFTALFLFVYVFLMLFNFCGEWLFWNEFGVRYNFIAVDYLVYTSEVIGNIMQSYSTGWILTAVIVISLVATWLLLRNALRSCDTFHAPGWRPRVALICFVPAIAAFCLLPVTEKAQSSTNAWYNGLQANGVYSFVQAFMSNRLEYKDFYITLPDDQVEAELVSMLSQAADTAAHDVLTPHIVLITMESMSADYMQRFGNDESLTPTLDSLWLKSLAFDRMFAAGNRTVRGLEAIVMSRPPTPGESIIKRPDYDFSYPSIVPVLKDKGYDCYYYYGGDSYFDNMESFFGGLGYEIRDRKSMDDSQVNCQTVWGVCDGDVYSRLLADMDSVDAAGGRAFAHLMTTSNHRPYIYPDGCVSIPPSKKSRKGAVMYSDYALGKFIEEAQRRGWGRRTVFVVVADHCASSAGSTELPLGNYHIPALIYSPELISPQVVSKTVSQIDVMPTLFAILGWQPAEHLYGRNILAPDFSERAFVATYQDMGYLEGDTLTVLSPGRKFKQYRITPTADDPYAMHPAATPCTEALNKAVTLYQSASH